MFNLNNFAKEVHIKWTKNTIMNADMTTGNPKSNSNNIYTNHSPPHFLGLYSSLCLSHPRFLS